MSSTTTRKPSVLTAEQEADFQAWRADALAQMPYFAPMLFSLRVVNSPGLGTFAVDEGHRLYIDFDAVKKQGPKFCSESLLHECAHLFGEHAQASRELGVTPAQHQTANIAADMAANDDLVAAGCTTFIEKRADGGRDPMPSQIGEPDGETPHHYFRALMAKMAAKDKVKPTIRLKPSRIAEGKVTGTSVTVTARPSFIDPSAATLSVTDAEGDEASLTVSAASASTLTFTLADELASGTYTVTVTSAGISACAELTVAPPRIRLAPDHITSTQVAAMGADLAQTGALTPIEVKVIGTLTAFSPSTVVMMSDENGNPVAVTGVHVASPTAIRFQIPTQVPAGLYCVETITGAERQVADLPIGLPHMEISPANLPTDYATPATLGAQVSDFTFDATTTVEVFHPLGVPLASCGVTVRDAANATLTLPVSLPEGNYLAVATTTDPSTGLGSQVSANLTVGDNPGGGGEDEGEGEGQGGAAGMPGGGGPDEGEGEGDGQGDGQGDGGEGEGQSGPFKGCGSGSGGQAAPCELGDDDLDGKAPAAGGIEAESIRMATAAAILDHTQKGRGTVPGGLVAQSQMILAPSTMPWRTILAAHVRRAVRRRAGSAEEDRTRRSRRRHNVRVGGSKIIYPGSFTPEPVIAYIRDTSGSMSATDIAMCDREVEAVARALHVRGDNLTVTDVDAQTHPSVPYRDRRSISTVQGRGGTDMRVGIAEAAARRGDARPHVIVVATDGGTPWPEVSCGIPVVACIIPQEGSTATAEEWEAEVPDWIKVVLADPAQEPGANVATSSTGAA